MRPLSRSLQAKLDHFRTFVDGWAFGEGSAFSDDTIHNAARLLGVGLELPAFEAVDVFPGRDGRVVATFYRGDSAFDFAVLDRSVRISEEQLGREPPDEREVKIREAQQ